jgi:hypothetical protein
MTCLTTTTWQCPNGDTGDVPPGTACICNAFRHPGWIPNNQLLNPDGSTCTKGIVCVVEGGTQFRVCGVSGLQPVQDGRSLNLLVPVLPRCTVSSHVFLRHPASFTPFDPGTIPEQKYADFPIFSSPRNSVQGWWDYLSMIYCCKGFNGNLVSSSVLGVL